MIKVVANYGRQIWNWFFRPPYNGVPWLVWLYVIIAICCYRHGGVFDGLLTGYDDPVRMTQALDWINGHGWYDRHIMRVDPPNGFQTIWSRIVDIPIALVILIAQQFVAQKTAALIAAVIIPMIELRLMFEAARYFVRPLVGKQRANLISLFLLFTSLVRYCNFSVSGFYAGEASHHPWYLILMTVFLGGLARVVLDVKNVRLVLLSGTALGLLLAVGIEGLPLIAGACALLVFIAWHFKRPGLASESAKMYASGAVIGLLLVPTHQPLPDLFKISFAEPSILSPILVLAAGLFLAIAHIILRRFSRWPSAVLLLIVGCGIGLLLLVLFPQVHDGAAAGLSPAERHMAFREHLGAQPLHKAAGGLWDKLSYVLPLLAGLVAGSYAIIASKSSRQRRINVLYFGLTGLSCCMAEWLARYYHYAIVYASGWLLWLWQKMMGRWTQDEVYTLKALTLFGLLAPLPILLMPSMAHNAPIFSQVVLFPAALQSVGEPCGLNNLARYIDEHYPISTNLLVPGADSSRMLFATKVTIDFLNNYPSQDRFIDNETFFGTQLPDVAREIARRHHVDLVAVCKVAMKPLPLVPGEAPMMFERLEAGQPPDWLKPVDMQSNGLYRLYEINRAAMKEGGL